MGRPDPRREARADGAGVEPRTGTRYMVIETFRGGDPGPVYARFRERGRLAPEGLTYVGSWVTDDLTRCYQVMECEDRALLDAWIAAWSDLVEFEVIAVISSPEASARVP
jgi:hypothetical protein